MPAEFNLDPEKDNYCVMGNPVAHSLSPRIHLLFAEQFQEPVNYQAVLVEESEFAGTVKAFFDAGGLGCNVTLPFKEIALASVNVVGEQARRAGAVNVMWMDVQGIVYGDSTDATGLIRDLENHQVMLAGRRILMAGAGGAARSVIARLLQAKPATVTIANRTLSRARALVRDFQDEDRRLSGSSYADLHGQDFDVVFNATSAGLSGDNVPLPDDILGDSAVCYDMVYGEGARPFLDWARKNGAALAVDGLGMLVEQAAESWQLWRGTRPDTLAVLDALQ